MEQDEIYLADLWRIATRQWRTFAAVAALVLVAAVTLAYLAHPQWEATAWIRVGQLGTVPAGEDPRAEPFQRVLDRLATVPFKDDVLQSMDIPLKSREAHLYRASFKLDPSPYAGLIKLNVRGDTPQQARRFAEATFERLKAIHDGIEAGPRKLALDRLALAKAQLADAQAERDRLRQAVAAAAQASSGKQDVLLASVAMTSANEEVRGLQQAVNDITARLSDSYSYDTSLAWPIYVPDRRAYPNRLLFVGIGLVLAMGLGAMAAIGRDARRRAAAYGNQPNPSRPALTP